MDDGREAARRASTCLFAGLLPLAAVVGLLAWDQEKHRGSDGNLHGPYEAWQILLCVAVLIVVAVWVGVRSVAVLGAAFAAAGVCLGVAIVGIAQTDEAGLVVGTILGALFGCLAFGGVLAVACAVSELSARRSGHRGAA